MIWTSELSHKAELELARLPKAAQRQIARAIDAMQNDPLAGDVVPLKGEVWKGRFRKRAGRYRIIFALDHSRHHILISAILLRSERTYRP